MFRRTYTEYWKLGKPQNSAMTAIVLSMLSISIGAVGGNHDFEIVHNTYRGMPVQWISACDDWLRQQSSELNKLARYQVSCLLYLAKRMNLIRKKRYLMETGTLMQNAIMDGLHRELSPTVESPYRREMKRRIWASIREMELQNYFEYGLPTLLHNIESDVAAPANLNDEDFDESSTILPASRPLSEYTCSSYQHHSSRSWALRLGLSRWLFSTGLSKKDLSYEDVLRYTHELTQELHSLPPRRKTGMDGSASKSSVLALAFLQFQLIECILAIHRPYMRGSDSKYWLSENICYQMSREILLLNKKLAEQGVHNLAFVREDLLLASLNLTRISILQPRGECLVFPSNLSSSTTARIGVLTMKSDSISMIASGIGPSIDVLEQCFPLMENRYLYCFQGEPWCVLTMGAVIMLPKIQAGKESRQTAKSSFAKRFLDLHYKHQDLLHTCSTSLPPETHATNIEVSPDLMWDKVRNLLPGLGSCTSRTAAYFRWVGRNMWLE